MNSISGQAYQRVVAQQRRTITQAERDSMKRDSLIIVMNRMWRLGYQFNIQGRYSEALPYYLEAFRLDKSLYGDTLKNTSMYATIGGMFIEVGKKDSALYFFEEGLKYNPKNDTNRYSFIVEYIQNLYWDYLKQYDKWLSFVEKNFDYIKTERIKLWALNAMKDMYKNKGENEKALKALERLMVLNPNNPDLENERLGLIRIIGGEDSLRVEFEKKLVINPKDTDVLWSLIVIYNNKSQYDKVLELTDKFLALKPKDIEALEKKANALKAIQQWDMAIAVYKELITLKSDDISYHIILSDMYRNSKKDLQQAAFWAFSARNKFPNDGRPNFLMGRIIFDQIEKVMVKNKRNLPSYEDKVIGKIAYDYYTEAAKDPNVKNDADQFILYLQDNYIPTRSDEHMYGASFTIPKDPDYGWIWNSYRIKK
jgi:tetratricopeptide (TPR) repeat protein